MKRTKFSNENFKDDKNVNHKFYIENVEFIQCFYNEMSIRVYRFIERLVYGKEPEPIVNKYKLLLESLGPVDFVKELTNQISFSKDDSEESFLSENKRKNIKESMLENFVIRNNKGKEYLNELKLKIFLKNIPNKCIKIKNGDIVDISDIP